MTRKKNDSNELEDIIEDIVENVVDEIVEVAVDIVEDIIEDTPVIKKYANIPKWILQKTRHR